MREELARPDFRGQARDQAQQAAARMPAGGPAAGAPQVHAYDDASGAPAPDWAREMIDDLRTSGIRGTGEVLPGQPRAAAGPHQVTGRPLICRPLRRRASPSPEPCSRSA